MIKKEIKKKKGKKKKKEKHLDYNDSANLVKSNVSACYLQ